MSKKFWIGVASRGHVGNSVKIGICQSCHSKLYPTKRLSKGNFVIYYSSKEKKNKSNLCKKFTAIEIVEDNEPYQVEMENTFKPFRHNVKYLKAQYIDRDI